MPSSASCEPGEFKVRNFEETISRHSVGWVLEHFTNECPKAKSKVSLEDKEKEILEAMCHRKTGLEHENCFQKGDLNNALE